MGPNFPAKLLISRVDNHCWGWATWKRAWQYYDVSINFWTELSKQKIFQDIFEYKAEFNIRKKIWDQVYTGKINSWDYQWYLTCIVQSGMAITPNINLISNIGFGKNSTHTNKMNEFANLHIEQINFPLIHPKFMLKNKSADNLYFQKMYNPGFSGLVNKIHRKFLDISKEYHNKK